MAYADWEKMANLVEELICCLAEKICGPLTVDTAIPKKNYSYNQLGTTLAPRALRDVLREVAGEDWLEYPPNSGVIAPRTSSNWKSAQLADFEVTQQRLKNSSRRKRLIHSLLRIARKAGATGKTKTQRRLAGRCFRTDH